MLTKYNDSGLVILLVFLLPVVSFLHLCFDAQGHILLGNQGHIFHFDREPVTMTSLCITREGDQKVPFLLDTMEFSALLNLRVSLSLSLSLSLFFSLFYLCLFLRS